MAVSQDAQLASLASRFGSIEHRLAALEAAAGLEPGKTGPRPEDEPLERQLGPEASPTQLRLAQELLSRGVTRFAFCRVPSSYYSWPLEGRRVALNAATVHHLCKTIVMVNTRAHPEVTDCSDPLNPKYYMVVVQYSARLNAEKLKQWAASLKNGTIPRKYYNLRLAPEEESNALTGFIHNAVTPVGSLANIPIVLSHKIAALPENSYFWMGGGEVDLKLGMKAQDFVRAYSAHVVDCTYDEPLLDGGAVED